MKIIISLMLLMLLACNEGNESVITIKQENIIIDSVGIDVNAESVTDCYNFTDSTELFYAVDATDKIHDFGPDSVEVLLNEVIQKFIVHLRVDDFDAARDMLHSNGVYYYTLGLISKAEFNLNGLKKRTGILDGAYSYGLPDEFEGQSDSVVNGLHWLDSLRYNYTEQEPNWHYGYGAVGYGFTGNYSSDHIYWDYFPYTPDSINIHLAYISHNNPEIAERDLLMIEFFEDEFGNWKIYGIGNLEWTP